MLGRWTLGWSRNVAIGVMWTNDGKIAFFFLGLTLSRGLPLRGTPCRSEAGQGLLLRSRFRSTDPTD